MKATRANQRQHAVSRPDSGFTLLELLAVIAIIGLLASFAIPAVFKAMTKAKVGDVKGQLAQLRTAVETYYADYDTFPPMGNDWLGGAYFPSEDIGTDQKAAFVWDNINRRWVASAIYTGPDTNATEMNYVLDQGEDLGLDNVANDPYDNSSGFPNFFSDNDGVVNETSIGDYAGYVIARTDTGMDEYTRYTDGNVTTGALDEYAADPPPYYNRWVLYGNGPDGKDHALHNYYIATQDGEDTGTDAFVSDPADIDTDYILFEPDANENNSTSEAFALVTIRETGYQVPAGMQEAAVTGSSTALDGPDGVPDFDYDTRLKKKSRRPLPDGTTYDGVIMLYGP
ncbi:MAG: type II secretion system protein [Candidatus Lindowbacteria bacterium]|nr:type II secretion system protein [Candidatus Lindowbacteria bacterium]